jgi:cyclopropane fatty-acyl-phospholipid synthase-like methyltransferase
MAINVYGRQLSDAEIDAKEHRDLVGGLWDELGALQFAFLTAQGLTPASRLLDLGCGALRGGVHFVRHLDAGNYYGMDINASLIEAGRRELAEAGLGGKRVHLLVSDDFELERFGTTFEYAIAVSVFTHLTMNHIVKCLAEVRRTLAPHGRFFASYFEAPTRAYLAALAHSPGDIVTSYCADPYHYAFEEMQWMAGLAELNVERIGDWGHPRDQQMLAFSRRSGASTR